MRHPKLPNLLLLGGLACLSAGCSDGESPARGGGSTPAGAYGAGDDPTTVLVGPSPVGSGGATSAMGGTAGVAGSTDGVYANECGVYMLTKPSAVGASAEETVLAFLESSGTTLGDFVDQLRPIDEPAIEVAYDPDRAGYGFRLIRYQQWNHGLRVYGGAVNLLVSMDQNYPLVLVDSTAVSLGSYQPSFAGVAADATNAGEVLSEVGGRIDLALLAAQATASASLLPGDAELVIWAGSKTACQSPRLAVVYDAMNDSGWPLFRLIVTLDDGLVASVENLWRTATLSGTVSALVTPSLGVQCNAAPGASPTGLPFLQVSVSSESGGAETRTTADGSYSVEGDFEGTARVSAAYRGAFFWVADANNPKQPSTDMATAAATDGQAALTFNSQGTDEGTARANAYFRAEYARQWVQSLDPRWRRLDPVVRIEVNHTTSSLVKLGIGAGCPNAYSGSDGALLFCGADSTKNASAAAVPDIIYHEYGHQLVYRATHRRPVTDAFHEGIADAVALFVSSHPDQRICCWAQGGTRALSESGLRPSKPEECNYSASGCSTCGDDTYACGTALASMFWDLRQHEQIGPQRAGLLLTALIKSWAPVEGRGHPLGAIDQIPAYLLTLDRRQHAEAICSVLAKHAWLSKEMSAWCCPRDKVWDPNHASCQCTGGRSLDAGVDPPACVCPEDRPLWNSGDETCEICGGGRVWNVGTKMCSCPETQNWNAALHICQDADVGCDRGTYDGTYYYIWDQADADALEGYTELTGSLSVMMAQDTLRLDGLRCLNRVGGTLEFSATKGLAELGGLENLTAVDGDVLIYGTGLTNLSGLKGLATVGGDLRVGDDLGLANPALTSIVLESLTSVGGRLLIDDDTALETIELESLASVGGSLGIGVDLHTDHRADALTYIGLASLGSVGGHFGVYTNGASLTTMVLGNLARVGGNVEFHDNHALARIAAGKLATIGGNLWLGGNFYADNPDAYALTSVDLGSLVTIGGDATVEDTSLANLELEQLTRVWGALSIRYNPLLARVAMGRLAAIGGKLEIRSNAVLTAITADSLTTVGGDLDVADNAQLPQCQACRLLGRLAGYSGLAYTSFNGVDACNDTCS